MSTNVPTSRPTSTSNSNPTQEQVTASFEAHCTSSPIFPTGAHVYNKRKNEVNDNAKEWSVDDVSSWLRSKGFDRGTCDIFAEKKIDGEALFALNIDKLKSEIGIQPYGVRMKIHSAIGELLPNGHSDTFRTNLSIQSNLGPEQLSQLPTSNALHQLWSRLWKSEMHQLFVKLTVKRDESETLADVPSTCWVLDVDDWIKELDPESSVLGILIRDEYWAALHDMVEYYTRGTRIFPTHSPTMVNESSKEVDAGELSSPFRNPFSDISAKTVTQQRAAILLGHPGVGKTFWLYFVLVLRLQAGLPTIFQPRRNRLFVFDEKGVRKLKYSSSTDASEYWPRFAPHTWCLIDSTLGESTLPQFIRDLCLFVVQASSPRAEHIRWAMKQSRPVLEYFLKPWSLSEIISGRTLQEVVHSEKDLLFFYTQYGPSARLAYTHASSADAYGDILKHKVAGISYQEVIRQATSFNVSNAIIHQVSLISPGTTRDVHSVSIATPHLERWFHGVLDDHVREASA